MALTKQSKIAKIEVVGEFKAVQVAVDISVFEDGVLLSTTRHRHVLHPNEDISTQDPEVQAICNTAWTDEIKSAWQTHLSNFQ